MERTYQTLSFGTARCIGIVRTMAILAHLTCLRICVMRCFGIVRTIPTSPSFICPEADGIISAYRFRKQPVLKQLCLHCGLAITVVERLQRYNCIAYIVNVEQNILFYIEVWSCEMLSLCGELIWRWNVVFRLCFVFKRTLYRRLWMNHFVLEELRDLFRCLVEPTCASQR